MMIFKEKMICWWLASLLLSGVGMAHPDQVFWERVPGVPMDAGESIMHRSAFPEGVPVEVLFSGRGFALLGNESRVLRLNIESVLPLEPQQVRNLLASNKSLEEIRDEIRSREGEAVYRGGMRLDKVFYPLVNIIVSASGGNSTDLEADVGAESGDKAVILGRITVNIAPAEGSLIGQGELNLSLGPQSGKYSVILDMQPPRHAMGRMGPRR